MPTPSPLRTVRAIFAAYDYLQRCFAVKHFVTLSVSAVKFKDIVLTPGLSDCANKTILTTHPEKG